MTDTLVLCYHAVSPTWPAALSVTPDAFARQLRMLDRAGYVGATFSDAVMAPPARRTVAITFDDAYRSELALAAPLLQELGWPATVFVPTDHVDAGGPMVWPGIDQWVESPYVDELLPLSWDEVRRLAQEGWEIGSHTCSHPRLTQIQDDQLGDELARSRRRIEEELQAPCTSVAYPYGDVDGRVVAAAREAGYRTGAGLPPHWRPERPMVIPRVGIWHNDRLWRAVLKAAVPVRRLQGHR
ncbi:MAG: polysaccharide deacetylase family protein [Solirubrobacteraceae bacterium]|nr:polysaccharide deacetylase family protein [Solirubrobacteraceae bacterium]